jgi:prevent-host-death family protein
MSIPASKFKAQCLAILDSLTPEGIIVTKHGVPVARLIPIRRESESLIGSLKGKITIHGDLHSTGEAWDADAES